MNEINKLMKTGIDAVLLSTQEANIDPNFYYFTQLSRTMQLSSSLILKKNTKPLIITSPLEYGMLKNAVMCKTKKEFENILKNNLAGCRKLGINYSVCPVSQFNYLKKLLKCKFIDISQELNDVRSIKTLGEIKKIRQACKITEEILDTIDKIAKQGMTERDVSVKLENEARKNTEGVAFPVIVASGKNSAIPHHISGKTRLIKGKILLIDFGVIYDGYCSDITRTFVLGKANVMQKHVYSVVLRAQKQSIKIAKKGYAYEELFNTANKVIKDMLHQNMIHGLSHGLGIAAHDPPYGKKWKLKENMVITVEPGYYKEFGVRIEDDIVVKRRAQLLSKAPDILIEI